MGRPKNFSREQALAKAMPVFWKHGFSHNSLQYLEQATGVNKSGLYSEFRDKEDLFTEETTRGPAVSIWVTDLISSGLCCGDQSLIEVKEKLC